uniref:Uncharacterized protein n=1 Tax=Fagus sylvatica TaxID=28930 RepID=A0A2N9FQD3_FAGSY
MGCWASSSTANEGVESACGVVADKMGCGGFGLPAWVWWLWVWVCRRGCGGYGWLPWLRRREWVLGGCRG